MKKRKLFGLTSLFLLLGVAGCFGDKPDEPAKEAGYVGTKDGHYKIDEKGNKIGDTEPHTYVEFEGDATHKPVAAECEIPGKICKQCTVCKKVIDESTPALGHAWGPSSDPAAAATCTRAGLQECSRCHKTQESGKPLGHQWGTNAENLTEGATDSAVKKYQCTACSAASYQIDVATAKLQLVGDSAWKTDPSTGAFKLNKDGHSCSFTFKLPAGFTGKMYEMAYMDAYSSNYSKKAFYETNNESNVEITVNGTAIDMSSQKDVKFSDILGSSDEDIAKSNSDVKQVLLGGVTLAAENTIVYKRVQTLNMIVSAFVFIPD